MSEQQRHWEEPGDDDVIEVRPTILIQSGLQNLELYTGIVIRLPFQLANAPKNPEYSVTTSNTSIATGRVEGNEIIVSAVGTGEATLNVIVFDAKNSELSGDAYEDRPLSIYVKVG